METEKTPDHSEENARAWMANIREMMVTALEAANNDEDTEAYENAREAIQEAPLSVCVRSTQWYLAGGEAPEPDEFEILLSTGGPALRITGNLDRYNQPENPRLEKQDWFTPWTEVDITDEDREALEKFTSEFYFGE